MSNLPSLDRVEDIPISIIKYLDSGSFSQVFLCQTPHQYAVLKITMSENTMPSIEKELRLFRLLQKGNAYLSQFIVRFLGGDKQPSYCCLLMEYCKMNMVQYMNTSLPQRLPLTTILHVLYDVAQGLYFLHSNKLQHRDIKLENILIKEPSKSSQYAPTYCICDFGSVTNEEIPPYTEFDLDKVKYDIERHTTLLYRAPEMIDLHLKLGLNYKVDMWALGCCLYKMLYYKNPFETEFAIVNYHDNLKPLLDRQVILNDTILLLLQHLLCVQPSRRYSSYDVLHQLCLLRKSTCPLPNIFEQQSQVSVQAQPMHHQHPLLKTQLTPIAPISVGMSEQAQERRRHRHQRSLSKQSITSPPDISVDFDLSAATLMQQVVHMKDLKDIKQLLKWYWQRYKLSNPIGELTVEMRKIMGQVNVSTTNVRGVFRCTLALHCLLLYGPDTCQMDTTIPQLLQGFEGYSNRLVSFYARYVKEYLKLIKTKELNGRYMAKPSVTKARAVSTHLQLHMDSFLSMKDSMSPNVDICLCLFLYCMDAVAALSHFHVLAGNDQTMRNYGKNLYGKVHDLLMNCMAYMEPLSNELVVAYPHMQWVCQHLDVIAIEEPEQGSVKSDPMRFWWIFE